jgi:hypothetical protein
VIAFARPHPDGNAAAQGVIAMPIVIRNTKPTSTKIIQVDDDEVEDPKIEQPPPLYLRFNRDPRIGPECFEVVSLPGSHQPS